MLFFKSYNAVKKRSRRKGSKETWGRWGSHGDKFILTRASTRLLEEPRRYLL